MLELLGRGYVVDTCITAFNSRQEERAYRIYVTDALGLLVGTSERWVDWVEKPKKPTQTAAEVKARITSKLRA